MRTRSTITTADGITWYYEQEGSGPHVVLIPDGMGDCQMFSRSVPAIAAAGFSVTTFDMPGMSRSASPSCPPESYQQVTGRKLASCVVGLLDALGIREPCSFWGSSSGGATVLALAAGYPDRVRNGMPHEVPTFLPEPMARALDLDDETVALTTAELPVRIGMITREAWQGLGDEVHARLRGNYVRWMRGYPPTLPRAVSTDGEDLRRRPLDWSVGGASPTAAFVDNVVTATREGVPFRTIPGGHFPYVCHPDEFSEYVVETCRKYVAAA
ncbi:hypothetical protein N3K66_005156 [Trichothecium roseum]|uniref:Uncharacterized protein n=1 Tax=Trichothecium roseum TaxID=47278 RepID=A0ACC0V362_9HYPO|nr:hypothetical protein N3K66_005156 [Trichothecium roseum]